MAPAIDFSEVKGLEPIPAGNYTATIIKATVGKSQQGNDKIDLQWKIEGGDYDGRIVFDTLTFTPKSLYRVKQTLTALDFPKDFAGEVTPDDLEAKSADITVDIEASTMTDETTGEPYPPRNRVKKVRAVGSGNSSNLSSLLS